MMFGITAAQFFADCGIAVDPETGEITCHLHRPLCRRQEMQEHGNRIVRDPRGLSTAEHFLEADGQDRKIRRLVVEPDCRSAGNGEMRRR